MRVCTVGTFDTPHGGHAAFLRKAALLGDDIKVGVLSDDFVEQYKGRRPLYNEDERCQIIREMGYYCHVTSDQRWFFIQHSADVIAVGSDWARKDYYAQIGMTQDEMDRKHITLAYVPYTYQMSSTSLKARVWDAQSHPAG